MGVLGGAQVNPSPDACQVSGPATPAEIRNAALCVLLQELLVRVTAMLPPSSVPPIHRAPAGATRLAVQLPAGSTEVLESGLAAIHGVASDAVTPLFTVTTQPPPPPSPTLVAMMYPWGGLHSAVCVMCVFIVIYQRHSILVLSSSSFLPPLPPLRRWWRGSSPVCCSCTTTRLPTTPPPLGERRTPPPATWRRRRRRSRTFV